MSDLFHRVRNFLNNIRDDDNLETNMMDIKVALICLDPPEISAIVSGRQLNIIFDCLNSSNEKQILLTCEILKLILPVVHVTQLIYQNFPALGRAIRHPMSEVKVVVLDQLIRAVEEDPYAIMSPESQFLATVDNLVNAINHDPEFLSAVGKCLCHEDASVGLRAVKFFTNFGKTKSGLIALCQPAFVRELIQNVGKENVYALRVFDVLVEISSTSGESLEYLENAGLMDKMVTFINTDDILAMLALVEVSTKLAITPHGWGFLKRHDVIKGLAEKLISHEDDPFSSLTFPGLSKFFGKVGQYQPSVLINDYQDVPRFFFSAIDSSDLNIFVPSLEVIGMIAYSPEGKIALKEQGEIFMRHVMGRLNVAVTALPTEWRIRGLHVLANVIHIETNLITPQISRLNEVWFNQLGSSALTSLVQMAQQPFSDIKSAAFTVILNMANQKWGQLKIGNSPGFLDYLLDRSSENEAEALQMKFDILKVIKESTKFTEIVLDTEHFGRIIDYVHNGPFYSPSVTEVAVEGAE